MKFTMLKNMSDANCFMNHERLASFATVDADNRHHVVPVFSTYVSNLKRNNNVAIAVYHGEGT